jgi:hypothetical protein
MLKINSETKKRKWDRFKIKGGAIVMLQKPRMINLGKPKLIELGPIVDISWGGIAIQYIDSKDRQIDASEISISIPPDGIKLENIPFETVSDVEVAELPDSKKIRRRSIKFGNMDQTQKVKLVNFLQNFTVRAK